ERAGPRIRRYYCRPGRQRYSTESVVMSGRSVPWVGEGNVALLTDLYELTMAQAYWRDGMNEPAVFSLFVRTLPRTRNFLLACGVADALALLETFRFSQDAL